MPKIICHMQNGHPFTIKSGVLIPGEAAKVTCTDWQAKCMREDCRVVILDKLPPKAVDLTDDEKAAAKTGAAKAAKANKGPKLTKKQKAAAKTGAAKVAADESEAKAAGDLDGDDQAEDTQEQDGSQE